MKTVRKGVFETNSSSCHALCMYNGDYPLSLKKYYDDSKSHVLGEYHQFIIKDFIDIPNVCVSFYDKVRALMVAIASDYWGRYAKYDDDWFMPEQIMGEYPLSKFPLLNKAVVDCLAEHGIDCAEINIEYPKPAPEYSCGEWGSKPCIIHVDSFVEQNFLYNSGLETEEDFKAFIEDPSRFITYLDHIELYKGEWECCKNDRQLYEEAARGSSKSPNDENNEQETK